MPRTVPTTASQPDAAAHEDQVRQVSAPHDRDPKEQQPRRQPRRTASPAAARAAAAARNAKSIARAEDGKTTSSPEVETFAVSEQVMDPIWPGS